MTVFEVPAEVLRRATKKLAGDDSRDGSALVLDGGGEMVALLSPRFAAAFGDWLDDEAADQDERTERCGGCDGRGLVNDGDPIPFDCPDCTHPHVLRVARELLRGDPS